MLAGIPTMLGVLGPLPFDVNIILLSGQSNFEDADALPIEEDEPDPSVIMLDTPRPRHFVGAFGTAGNFVPCQGSEFLDDTVPPNRWGGNMAIAVGKSLLNRIEIEDGLTRADHGQKILPVHIGRSGSSVAQFSGGTETAARVIDHLTAVKARCVAEGKTVGIIAGAWGWGANAYDLNIGYAAAVTAIDGYWKLGGFVDTQISPIFGQQGYEFPVGFMGAASHGPRGFQINPYVSDAENWLVRTYARYHMISGEGPLFYNGADRGYSGSGVHHSAREAALMGALIGWWVKRVVCGGGWASLLPTFEITGPRRIEASLEGLGAGHIAYAVPTGNSPGAMQPNYGWCFCLPETPTVLLALARPPYLSAGKLVFDFAADLPVDGGGIVRTLEVRHGAYASNNINPGNLAFGPAIPEATYSVRGVAWPLHHHMPALREQIAA